MSELFPHSDETAETMTIDGAVIAGFDLDGARYCVDCAKQHEEIEVERWHNRPRSVPYGGSVMPRHIRQSEVDYHCANSDCGRKIPETA